MAETQRGNQLGSYRLGPRYRDTQDMGRVYRAYNVDTGAPALVLQRTERQADDQPLANWQVRVTSSVSPPFLALEVERAPTTGLPADVAEEFVVMLGDAEQLANAVVDRPETLSHLRSARRPPPASQVMQALPAPPPAARPSPRRRRPSLAAGLAAAAAAALLHLGGGVPGLSPGHDAVAELAQADVDGGWLYDAAVATGFVMTNSTDDLPLVLARPLPRQPFKNQKLPPCKVKEKLEVEIHGGCWVPHEVRAPCPDELYEFAGKCYLPAAKQERSPTALSADLR